MTRLLVGLCCAVFVAGCGSSTTVTTTGGANSSQAAQSSSGGAAASAPAGGSGRSLVISGSLSLKVAEGTNSASACQPGSGNVISGQLVFDSYVLQLSVPIGTTTYPQTTSPGAVAFYNGNDSQQEWSVGTNVSKTAAGTVTISAGGKFGTIDADMLPDTPRPNPALKPIHVKGTFACP